MTTFFTRASEGTIAKLAQEPPCAKALDWIGKNSAWVTTQQISLNEIPAPEFHETKRGEHLKGILEAMGLKVRTDKVGNVIAERPGAESSSIVLLAAHLDTVFPAGTDVRVRRVNGRIEAPGISDNGAGLGGLVGLAQALAVSQIRTGKTIVLAGDVGEEGEGNLRGIRALVEHYGARLAAVIALDGPSIDHITTQGIASQRIEVNVTGPGGHSWSDFGTPNPITALARGIVEFSAVRPAENPRSTYNFGVIESGTSVNSIPAKAKVKVDLRSEDEAEVVRMDNALQTAMQSGVREEMAVWAAPGNSLQVSFRSLGSRPAGKLPESSLLLQTIRDVDRYLGNNSRLERSSTDANVPLSLNIPAVSLGAGGKGGGSHTLREWFDPARREIGLKRLFLSVVALSELQP